MGIRPSVILIREWEQQMSSSGCCGRLEGDFLSRGGEPVFSQRREAMESMGSLYRAVRERFGDTVDLQVVDPRSWPTLLTLLVRDYRQQDVGFGELLHTLFRLPVRGVVVNGRLVARNEWPPEEVVFEAVEEAISA
ncbi:MAG: hypothetical protein WEG36_01795 [Gemmatimonadota bacterium]